MTMKLALCALLLVTACSSKKKHDETPAPRPAPPSPADAAVPVDAPPPPPCIIDLVIAEPIRYSDGARISGEIPHQRGAKLDLSALGPVAARCSGVNLIVEQTTKYSDIIGVFDALVGLGFDNLTLGSHEHHQKAQLPVGTTRSSLTNEGKIVGRFEAKPAGEMPVIVIAADKDITVSGKRVGKTADQNIVALVAHALPDATATHTLILQADQSLTQADVSGAVQGADLAGYTNLVFGMTAKKKK